jgi:hypothetical protein
MDGGMKMVYKLALKRLAKQMKLDEKEEAKEIK